MFIKLPFSFEYNGVYYPPDAEVDVPEEIYDQLVVSILQQRELENELDK